MATKKVVADHDFLIPEFKLTQVADINYEKLPIIRRSSDAVEVLSKYIAQKDLLTQISVNEFAFVLYLNKQNRVIGITNLSIGGLDSTLMDVRMVYSMAVKIGASSIIVAHNHPSQNLKPSEADIRMSNLMRDGGKSLTIQVLDFLIITSSSGYYSFGDEGMMERGGIMAKGGITEHGLRVGDTIVSEIDENTIVVENPTSGRRTINISTGHPMAKGGRMGFKALSEKVASHYAGKSVPTKYQPEYGKFYDADEAKTVGNKVAAKVYRLQQGK
jgi:DNA repair protein RadC